MTETTKIETLRAASNHCRDTNQSDIYAPMVAELEGIAVCEDMGWQWTGTRWE